MIYPQACAQEYGGCSANLVPVATLAENSASYVFFFEVPGTKAEDIEVLIQGQYLTIRGKQAFACLDKDIELVQSERWFGPFQRTVMIPAPIEHQQVQAKLEDGILEVRLLKQTDNNIPFAKVHVNKGATKGHSSNTSKGN